jgi:hypothetical protein
MTTPPQNSCPPKNLSPLPDDDSVVHGCIQRLMGAGGLTNDIAGPVAQFMEAMARTGDITPDRMLRALAMAVFALGAAAVENAHPLEAHRLPIKLSEQLGKAVSEVARFSADCHGGGTA